MVTVGAGFIGSHLFDRLIEQKDYEVSILDNLEQQVHGKSDRPPSYLNRRSNFFQGSISY